MDKISISKIQSEIDDTDQAIQKAIGKTSNLFAPPSGAYNQKVVDQAKLKNKYTILWTLDTVDWKRPSAATIVSRIVTRAQNGALVLMHPTAPTAQALKGMIPKLKSKGFELVTVSELLSPYRPIPTQVDMKQLDTN